MESIFFRRLEQRRSTQTLVNPTNVMSLGGFGNINPSAGSRSTCFDYGWPPPGCLSFLGNVGCLSIDFLPSCYAINSIDFSDNSPSSAVGCSYIFGGGCSYQALTGVPYGNILGSCPRIDSLGLQSVVGTLGNLFSGSNSSYNIGQYNIGTYNWGGYNRGVGNIMGSCPRIDSLGLQSVVGTLGNIFSGGGSSYSSCSYNVYSAIGYGYGSLGSSGFGSSYINSMSRGCYDFGGF